MILSSGEFAFGLIELAVIAGFAALGASRLRARFAPELAGAGAILASAVLAVALVTITAEILGTFGLFESGALLACVAAVGVGLRLAVRLPRERSPRPGTKVPSALPRGGGALGGIEVGSKARMAILAVCFGIAAVVFARFAIATAGAYGTGMTGFDSTWYQGPFAALMAQSGSTFELNPIAPQYLSWFYPQNTEVLHAIGILTFGRDLISPGVNLLVLAGCMLACWCIGRTRGLGVLSLAGGCVVLGSGILTDQAGEARGDLLGIFFTLAAIAIAVESAARTRPNPAAQVRPADTTDPPAPADPPASGSRMWDPRKWRILRARATGAGESPPGVPHPTSISPGALVIVGVAAGMAAGTKLHYLASSAAIVVAVAAFAMPAGRRLRSGLILAASALIAGGYWYLRNLIHTGNPLPWITSAGPVELPGPDQEIGGRESHGVVEYLADPAVWSDWFVPGLREGLTLLWPVVIAAALASTILLLRRRGLERAVGAVILAAAVGWLLAPASAEGPAGEPVGFVSGLRYLAPALVLALAFLPVAVAGAVRSRVKPLASDPDADRRGADGVAHAWEPVGDAPEVAGVPRRAPASALALTVLFLVAAVFVGGDRLQRHYLENRYADPDFATPGLAVVFEWANEQTDTSIATTATRQYPLFGPDLSNRVEFVGVELPQGGYVRPESCPQFREAVNRIAPDYLVTAWDRDEPGRPALPPEAEWAATDRVTSIHMSAPGAAVFAITAPLDPSTCP